jgi:hypothetical protein
MLPLSGDTRKAGGWVPRHLSDDTRWGVGSRYRLVARAGTVWLRLAVNQTGTFCQEGI